MLMLNKLTANYYHAFQTLFPSKNVISFEIIILIIFLTSLQLFKTFKVSMHNSKLRCWKYYINFMAKLIQLKPLHSTNKRFKKESPYYMYVCKLFSIFRNRKNFFGTTWRLIFSRLIFMIIFICFSRFASHSLFLTPKRGPDRCQSDFWNCFTSQKTLEDCSQSIVEVEHLVESRVTRQKLYIIQSCSRTHLSFFFLKNFKQISNQSDHLDGNASHILEAINLFKTCTPLQLQNELSIVIMFWARL